MNRDKFCHEFPAHSVDSANVPLRDPDPEETDMIRSRRRRALGALLLTLALPLSALATGQEGENAAAFTHTDTQGVTHAVSFAGQATFLFFVGYA